MEGPKKPPAEKIPPSGADYTNIPEDLNKAAARHQIWNISERDTWYFGKVLYQTDDRMTENVPQKSVSIWLCLDANDNLKIPIVVKQDNQKDRSQASREELAVLTQNEEAINRVLMEKNSRHILDFYACTQQIQSMKKGRERIRRYLMVYSYLEYAPYGDLAGLLQHYQDNKDLLQIPEAFLWIVFRALAEAVALLQTGKVKMPPSRKVVDPKQADVDKTPLKDWTPIVHQDIKPQNIVLAEADDYYPAFKLPKMIDFGISFREGDKERDANILEMWDYGTFGYKSPEQSITENLAAEYKKRKKKPPRINCSSDIYGIGRTMATMVSGMLETGTGSSEAEEKHDGKVMRKEEWPVELHRNIYSPELVQLIKGCQRFEQKDRPPLDALLQRTHEGLVKYQHCFGVLERQPDILEFERTWFPEDRFPLGISVPEDLIEDPSFAKRKRKNSTDPERARTPSKKRRSNPPLSPARPRTEPPKRVSKLPPKSPPRKVRKRRLKEKGKISTVTFTQPEH